MPKAAKGSYPLPLVVCPFFVPMRVHFPICTQGTHPKGEPLYLCCVVVQVEESDDDEGDGGDDDLYAFTSIADSPSQPSSSHQQGQDQGGDATGAPPRSRQPGGFGGPTVFASMTFGMNDAMLHINRAFQQMTVRAQHRRSLLRPS